MRLLNLGVRILWRWGDIVIWAFGMIGLELERGRVQSAHLEDEAWFLDTRLGNDWMLDFRSCSGICFINGSGTSYWVMVWTLGHPFIFWNRISKATKAFVRYGVRIFHVR